MHCSKLGKAGQLGRERKTPISTPDQSHRMPNTVARTTCGERAYVTQVMKPTLKFMTERRARQRGLDTGITALLPSVSHSLSRASKSPCLPRASCAITCASTHANDEMQTNNRKRKKMQEKLGNTKCKALHTTY